jgi:hypothetical protein
VSSTPEPRGTAGVVLTVRFLTELALLAGLAVAGARLGDGVALSIVNAVLLPAAAAAVWGGFVAPKAGRRLPDPARFVVEFLLFATAGALLVLTGWVVAGLVVAVAGIGIAALTRTVAKGG